MKFILINIELVIPYIGYTVVMMSIMPFTPKY